jgi:small ligand-binding sensory domain FIST
VPDGRALAPDDNYAILWDAKVRSAPYSLGTDDRAIREYITTQSRELSRRYRNIYYIIVSSSFADDFDDTIASIKMETDVSEVILLDAEALVAIVDAKLRAPLQLTLGPDGLQRLFAKSGGLTAAMVRGYQV